MSAMEPNIVRTVAMRRNALALTCGTAQLVSGVFLSSAKTAQLVFPQNRFVMGSNIAQMGVMSFALKV